MNVIVLSQQQMHDYSDEKWNPPDAESLESVRLFQLEIRDKYRLIARDLMTLGNEGTCYGESDFSLRPDLRDRAKVHAPPAALVREFQVTILTERFYQTKYLEVLNRSLRLSAIKYRIVIDQDFDMNWYMTLFLLPNVVQIYCSDSGRRERLVSVASQLPVVS